VLSHLRAHVSERGNRRSGYRNDLITVPEPGRRGGTALADRTCAPFSGRGATEKHEDDERQGQGNDEVHRRARHGNADALQKRLPSVGACFVGRVDLVRVHHPDDPHVRTGRNRFEPVLHLAAVKRPDSRAKPDEELGDLHAGATCHQEVTELVEEDHHDQAHDHNDRAEPLPHPQRHQAAHKEKQTQWIGGRRRHDSFHRLR